jgi:hypothetical protein
VRVTTTKAFKFLVCPAIFSASLFWLLLTARLLGLITLSATAVLYFQFLRSGSAAWMRLAWVIFVISILAPIDISFKNYPGPPRFVPLVMGLVGVEGFKKDQRGEIMLGGCVVRGHEPRWVWVW